MIFHENLSDAIQEAINTFFVCFQCQADVLTHRTQSIIKVYKYSLECKKDNFLCVFSELDREM